jgi:hypothetical protein
MTTNRALVFRKKTGGVRQPPLRYKSLRRILGILQKHHKRWSVVDPLLIRIPTTPKALPRAKNPFLE